MNVTAVPASAPAGRDPHKSPERKRRGFFRAVTAVPASASAGRDPQYKPGAQATGIFSRRHRRPGVGSGWA